MLLVTLIQNSLLRDSCTPHLKLSSAVVQTIRSEVRVKVLMNLKL